LTCAILRCRSSATKTIPNQTGWQQTFVYDRYGNRNFDEANTTTLPKNCVNGAMPVVCTADIPRVNPAVDPSNNKLIGYQFDNSGNTKIDAENRSFIYDSENKQVEVRDQANTVIGQYFYNGDGQRIKKVVPSPGETIAGWAVVGDGVVLTVVWAVRAL
jgi:hypothetical protein